MAQLQRTSTLSSASISEGNLTIRRGGNLRVIDGGSIIGEGDGDLEWEGDASFGGELDVTGETHIGGDLLIDGNTTLGGNLTFGSNTVPPEALVRRVEANTAGSNGSGTGTNRTQSVTLTPPAWAQTVSVMAFGTASATASPIRLLAHVTIDGQDGPGTEGASDLAVTLPAAHVRTFPASGPFQVSVWTGVQGINPVMIFQTISAMVTYVKSS